MEAINALMRIGGVGGMFYVAQELGLELQAFQCRTIRSGLLVREHHSSEGGWGGSLGDPFRAMTPQELASRLSPLSVGDLGYLPPPDEVRATIERHRILMMMAPVPPMEGHRAMTERAFRRGIRAVPAGARLQNPESLIDPVSLDPVGSRAVFLRPNLMPAPDRITGRTRARIPQVYSPESIYRVATEGDRRSPVSRRPFDPSRDVFWATLPRGRWRI